MIRALVFVAIVVLVGAGLLMGRRGETTETEFGFGIFFGTCGFLLIFIAGGLANGA